jgi:hypothetical protein
MQARTVLIAAPAPLAWISKSPQRGAAAPFVPQGPLLLQGRVAAITQKPEHHFVIEVLLIQVEC